LSIEELATVKSAFPSVVTHSDALEFHSLFSTVYCPPATAAVCELHKVVVAAWAVAVAETASAAAAASIAEATASGLSTCVLTVMRLVLFVVRRGNSRGCLSGHGVGATSCRRPPPCDEGAARRIRVPA
jgi:hypothetical protein